MFKAEPRWWANWGMEIKLLIVSPKGLRNSKGRPSDRWSVVLTSLSASLVSPPPLSPIQKENEQWTVLLISTRFVFCR